MDAYLNIDSASNFSENFPKENYNTEISSKIDTSQSKEIAVNHDKEESSLLILQETAFESCIQFYGCPILPPILSLKDREEMLKYKELAKAAEINLRNKRRKKLIDKVTSVLNTIEERKTIKTLPIENSMESSDAESTSSSAPTRTNSTILSDENEEIDNPKTENLMSSDSGISSKMRTSESKSLASTGVTICPDLEGSALLANVSLHDETASTVCSDNEDQKTSDSITLTPLENKPIEDDEESNHSTETKTSYTLESPCAALQEQYKKGLVSNNMDMELTHSFSEENLKRAENEDQQTDCSVELEKEEEEEEEEEEYIISSIPLNEVKKPEEVILENSEVESNGNTSSNALDEDEHNDLKCLAEMYANAEAKDNSDISNSEITVDQPTCIEKLTELSIESPKDLNEIIASNDVTIDNDQRSEQLTMESNSIEEEVSKKNIPNISDQSPCYRLQRRQMLDEESEMRKQHLKRYLEELSRMPNPGDEILVEKPSIEDLVDFLNSKVLDQDLINQKVNLRRLIDDHEDMINTLSKSEIKELENSLFEKMKERLLSMRDDFVTSTPIENTPERPTNNTNRFILSEEELHRRFCKFSALVKGYLTRKLLYTDKVQDLLGTVKDTADFALHFEKDSTLRDPTAAEIMLQERVLSQLTAAMYNLHYLFIETSTLERMTTIRLDREKKLSEKKKLCEKKVSTATLKRRSRIESREKQNIKRPKPISKTLKPTLCKSPEKLDKEALNRSKKAATMRVQRKLLLDEIEKECATLAKTKKKQPTSEKSAKKSMTRKTASTVKPMVRHIASAKR